MSASMLWPRPIRDEADKRAGFYAELGRFCTTGIGGPWGAQSCRGITSIH